MKISFDFDHTLTQPRIQKLATQLIKQKHEVWIVTSRFDNLHRAQYPDLKSNEDIFLLAKQLGIPQHRIGFTNQQPKWILLSKANFNIHIDDDLKEIASLEYYNKVTALFCNAENFEEKAYETINAITDFNFELD